jgi:drug/metabolite transporter (DMT)-like permease
MAAQRVLAISLVIVIGVLAVIAGVIYLTVEAKSLPSFLGQLHNDTAHRSLRGIIALVVGAVLLAGGSAMIAYRPREQRP